MHDARASLQFIPQRLNRSLLRLVQWLLPLLLRLRLRPWLPAGISEVTVVHVERMVQLYQQFQAGKIRFIIAFRHAEVDDPLCMLYMFSRSIPQAARRLGVQLRSPIHSHFVYDRGMTIWAGNWLGWFFSRLGGFPIHRGKSLDRVGIRAARDILINGQLPLTIAPEGATNGHSEKVSPLEPGVARMGFWCLEDLQKAQRVEQVFIVPVGIQYSYAEPPWAQIEQLLRELETDCGLSSSAIDPDQAQRLNQSLASGDPMAQRLYPRLFRLAEYLILRLETFYQRFYHQPFPAQAEASPQVDVRPQANASPETAASPSPNQILVDRLQILLDRALRVSEHYFGLSAQGTIIDRCRRLEEAGWKYIYREDIPDLEALAAFDRGLANWTAAEANLLIRHMRLVESFVAVTSTYVPSKPSAERFAEMALLMFDVTARIKGVKVPRRPRLGWRQVKLSIAEPISVSDRWLTYQRDRLSSKQAVSDLTNDLQLVLEKLIDG